MLVQADAKQLEWRVAAFLSQDRVAIKEILNNVDIHSDNQNRFNLPTRLIAKTYLFRLLFGGSAYSYSVDPEFSSVGFKEQQWQDVIDETYNKYPELGKWHKKIVKEVELNGMLRIPSGRFYPFRQENGKELWPVTKIKNYPVQGLAADLMMIARVSAWNRLGKNPDIKFINTIHDSIVLDLVDKGDNSWYNIAYELENVFKDVPRNFEKLFKVPFNVPLAGEVSYGPNLKDLKEYNSANQC